MANAAPVLLGSWGWAKQLSACRGPRPATVGARSPHARAPARPAGGHPHRARRAGGAGGARLPAPPSLCCDSTRAPAAALRSDLSCQSHGPDVKPSLPSTLRGRRRLSGRLPQESRWTVDHCPRPERRLARTVQGPPPPPSAKALALQKRKGLGLHEPYSLRAV